MEQDYLVVMVLHVDLLVYSQHTFSYVFLMLNEQRKAFDRCNSGMSLSLVVHEFSYVESVYCSEHKHRDTTDICRASLQYAIEDGQSDWNDS